MKNGTGNKDLVFYRSHSMQEENIYFNVILVFFVLRVCMYARTLPTISCFARACVNF